MSYDVWLEGDLSPGEDAPLDANYTYNVAGMFRAACGSTPNDWNGLPADDVAAICETILTAFEANHANFIAMNPANGWGDFGGASRFIRRIREACLLNPRATVRVA